jgi:nickel transport protein
MRGRIGAVSRPCVPVLLALLLLLLAGGTVRAHRLQADCFLLPGWRIQVESWFETRDSPPAARVQVFGADGRLLTEGRLNQDGIFVFPFREVESLRVVVSAGDGHRAEVPVAASALARYAVCTAVASLPDEPASLLRVPALLSLPAGPVGEGPAAVVKRNPPPESAAGGDPFAAARPLADRSSPWPLKDVLIGVGFLLAVAAFVLGVRNARELRRLRQQGPGQK